jgi:hypothetical protein
VNAVPQNVSLALQITCYDCNSRNTKYPRYIKVQPVACILESHLEEAKTELNFSEWDTYSDRRKRSKLKSIVSQIEDEAMPLSSYTFIHGDANLSPQQKEKIINWVNLVLK